MFQQKKTGTVKSWNGSKGFGFINCPNVIGDVMFGRTDLPQDAQEVRGKFLDGRSVRFDLQMAKGRAKATNVEVIAGEGEFMAGTIKSYNSSKGYGFIASSMATGDVLFNGCDLQSLADGADPKGHLVVFQAQAKPDGKLHATRIMFQSKKIAEKCGFTDGAATPQTAQNIPPSQQSQISQLSQTLMTQLIGQLNHLGQTGQISQMGQVAQQIAQLAQLGGAAAGGAKRPAPSTAGTVAVKKPKPSASSEVEMFSTGQYHQGDVKSYNAVKGFGFITSSGLTEDVFFMRSALPVELQSQTLQGCFVTFELAKTPDGKLRALNVTTE
mmetsp:Transcript_8318/g.21088  ORF Transcript_8318/g.21088 Transcript_8318/m.21088 type:complete len:326 (+) Transcript_8318:73-1050(+)